MAGVGTPGPVGPVGPFGVAFFAVVVVVVAVVTTFEPVPRTSLPPFGPVAPVDPEPGFLLFVDPGWLEEGVVLEPGVVVPLGDVVVVAVTEGVVVAAGVGAHESVTLWTGGVFGGRSWDAGVFGLAVTVNVSVWPVSSVAVTVHSSAEAEGITATPMVTSTEPAVAAMIFSLRLFDTLF